MGHTPPWCATYADALTGALFVDLLRRMLRGRRKPLQLILDRLPAHKPLAVTQYVARFGGKRIVHDPPSYAPDLTPDTWIWRHARVSTPPARLQKGERLADRITAPRTKMARRPAPIRSFSRHPRVLYISAC